MSTDPAAERDSYTKIEPESASQPQRFPQEELPPVEPPSAGFIVQLFVVPGLIVLVIVGVWVLFGKLAAGEQDWRKLVTEIRSDNPLRRGRAMVGLAQLIKADQSRGEQSQDLAHNKEIATSIAQILNTQLDQPSPSKEDLVYQVYLTKTLGWLYVPDVTLSALRNAVQSQHDLEIRSSALASIISLLGHFWELDESITDPDLQSDLIATSQDQDKLLRQLSAYALGLMPLEAAQQRLSVMLVDADSNTRINAAVGLARQHQSLGFEVLLDIISRAECRYDPNCQTQAASQVDDPQQQQLAIRNALKAVGELADELSGEHKAAAIEHVQGIIKHAPDARVRVDAQSTRIQLQEQSDN